MTYTQVGSTLTNSSQGTTTVTVTLNPTAVGDVIVVCVGEDGANIVTSIAHSGVSTWNTLVANPATNGISFADAEVWWGVITATGSATLTVTMNGSATDTGIAVYQFHSSVSGTWAADATTGSASATATSGNYPSVSSAESAIFLGAAGAKSLGPTWGGATSGFTYASAGPIQAVFSLAAPSPSAPAWTQTPGVFTAFADGFLFVPAPSPGGDLPSLPIEDFMDLPPIGPPPVRALIVGNQQPAMLYQDAGSLPQSAIDVPYPQFPIFAGLPPIGPPPLIALIVGSPQPQALYRDTGPPLFISASVTYTFSASGALDLGISGAATYLYTASGAVGLEVAGVATYLYSGAGAIEFSVGAATTYTYSASGSLVWAPGAGVVYTFTGSGGAGYPTSVIITVNSVTGVALEAGLVTAAGATVAPATSAVAGAAAVTITTATSQLVTAVQVG